MPSRPPLSKQAAAALLEANIDNIKSKLAAGKSLSQSEIHLLSGYKNENTAKAFATSKVELAEYLKISTAAVNALIAKAKADREKGMPAPDRRHNRFFFAEWVDFYKLSKGESITHVPIQGGAPDGEITTEQLARRKRQIELQSLEIDLAIKQDEYRRKSEIRDHILRCNEKVRAELSRRFIVTAPSEYAAVEGNADECRKINERHLDDVFRHLSKEKW